MASLIFKDGKVVKMDRKRSKEVSEFRDLPMAKQKALIENCFNSTRVPQDCADLASRIFSGSLAAECFLAYSEAQADVVKNEVRQRNEYKVSFETSNDHVGFTSVETEGEKDPDYYIYGVKVETKKVLPVSDYVATRVCTLIDEKNGEFFANTLKGDSITKTLRFQTQGRSVVNEALSICKHVKSRDAKEVGKVFASNKKYLSGQVDAFYKGVPKCTGMEKIQPEGLEHPILVPRKLAEAKCEDKELDVVASIVSRFGTAIGGSKMGQGRMSQYHMDGISDIVGWERRRYEAIIDFHPTENRIYFVDSSDVSYARGVYWKVIKSGGEEPLVIFKSNTLDSSVSLHLKDGEVLKPGVIGVPLTLASGFLQGAKVSYFSPKPPASPSSRSGEISDTVKTLKSHFTHLHAWCDTIQCYVHIKVAAMFGKDSFRVSSKARNCYVVYDSSSNFSSKKVMFASFNLMLHALLYPYLSLCAMATYNFADAGLKFPECFRFSPVNEEDAKNHSVEDFGISVVMDQLGDAAMKYFTTEISRNPQGEEDEEREEEEEDVSEKKREKSSDSAESKVNATVADLFAQASLSADSTK